MILQILQYELKQRFTHWMTILLYSMLIFQGIWYTQGTFEYYVNEGLLMNAPAIFYKNLAGGGILMIIIVAVITGPVLYKDIQHKTGQWVFTNPMNEKSFYVGRFLSALIINILVGFGYIIGMLLVPYVGIGAAHRFGPAPFGQLIHGYFVLLIPNLFLLTSITFFALVYFKRMAVAYLGVLVTVVSFLVMQTTAEASGATPFILLCDPFGYVSTEQSIDLMNVEARNSGYLSMSGYLLVNRIIWLSVSSLLFFLSFRKFSFKHFLLQPQKKRKTMSNEASISVASNTSTQEAQVFIRFTLQDFLRKLVSLTTLEFKNVVRPSGFKVIIGIVILMSVLQNLLWNASYYIGDTMPVTSNMTMFRLSFGVFITILIMVWAGELFFKDRITQFWQVADAMPVPVWVTTISRFLAMAGVSFLFACTFMFSGIFAQTVKGGFSLIDIPLYVYDLLGYNWGWLSYVMQIAFVFFIAGLTKNRFATHIISVGFYFITILAFELGLAEQVIYAYAAVPGLEDYSEVSGYGIWMTSAQWFFLMWALLAIVFILSGIWFWQRGINRNFLQSISLRNRQLSLVGKLALLIFFIGFIGVRNHIIDQVNGIGNFVSGTTEEEMKANYEKKFSYLQQVEHPKYGKIDLVMHLYPNERKAEYEATLALSRNSNSTDTLFLNFEDFVQVKDLSISGEKLKKLWNNEALKIAAWKLPQQVINDSIFTLHLKAIKAYTGFTQSGENPQPDLMYNGSFANLKAFLPTIGYDDTKELLENRKREDYGLAKLTSRMAEVNDIFAINQSAFTTDAHRVTGSITISTKSDQIAIASGELIKQWKEEDRVFYKYNIAQPSPFDWYVGSADYNVKTFKTSGVKAQILHEPKHHFNIDFYEEAITDAISFVEQNLGNFPFKSIKIAEIPYYQEAFYSSPNLIAISEKEGWYANHSALKEQAYIYQTVSSQIIKQWLYANLDIANVQGADMLKNALPEALALKVVEQSLGKAAVGLILETKNNQYVKDKNNEANSEPPLLYADGADYLEKNKGAIALYELGETMQFNSFTETFVKWVKENEYSYVNFTSLYEHLSAKLGVRDIAKLESRFTEVTQ